MQTSLQCGGELIYGASADRAAQSGAPQVGETAVLHPPLTENQTHTQTALQTDTEQTHTLTQPLTMVKYLVFQINMQKQS